MFRCKNICLTLVSILFLMPSLLNAQLTVDGEFRPRTEYRNGYQLLRTSATEPAYFVSQRTRLSATYESENYTIKVAGQDVRVWGEVNQLQDNPNLNIHEAWGQVEVSEVLALKMGRQELVYDNQRLLGSVNWTQQGRSHDALLLKYGSPESDLRIDIGGAYNQESENIFGNDYGLNNYKFLSYLWLNKSFGDLEASAIAVTDGFDVQLDKMNYRYTYGTFLDYSNQPWQISGSAYVQQGDDAARRNISAHMFAVKGSYSFSGWQLTAGYDYLSGGSAGDASPARHTFSTLYATNHKFYGNMDYFLSIPADTRGGGLQDLYLGAGFTINRAAQLNLTYHNFALANEIVNPQNPTEVLKQRLGSEFDFSFSYQFTEDISFKAGYSMLFSTTSLEQLQSRNAKESQHWGWAMLQITPQILQTSD